MSASSSRARSRSVGSRGGRPSRKGVTVERIVDAAVALLDEEGADALTTTRIAGLLDISQPTLYSHVTNLDEIRTMAAIRGMEELGLTVRLAVEGQTGFDAICAMAYAYRTFVREHPALYLLQQRASDTPTYWTVAHEASQAVRDVLRANGVPEDRVITVHYLLRASIHGFVDLEIHQATRDIEDSDPSFNLFLRILAEGLDIPVPATPGLS